MPPLFRIDAGKDVFYALDEAELERFCLKLKAKIRKLPDLKDWVK
jgi:topoisomerase-4 subunit B